MTWENDPRQPLYALPPYRAALLRALDTADLFLCMVDAAADHLRVLGVTEDSYGNAVGLGNADYTTRKVANHIDLLPMYMNSITAAGTEGARIPAVLADDRTVIQAVVATCWRSNFENVRLCQIRSTLHLQGGFRDAHHRCNGYRVRAQHSAGGIDGQVAI